MRILADSNIFIKYWKTNEDAIGTVFENQDVVICGVITAELLHGARSEKEIQGIQLILDSFDSLEMDENDWQQVGINLMKLRLKGLNLPFPDVIIATLGLKYNIPVWTFDQHFVEMKSVFTDLELYDLSAN